MSQIIKKNIFLVIIHYVGVMQLINVHSKDYDEHMKKWPIFKIKNYLEKIIKDKTFVSYWTDIFDEQYSKKFQAWGLQMALF